MAPKAMIGDLARPRSRSPARDLAPLNVTPQEINELEFAVAQTIKAGATDIKIEVVDLEVPVNAVLEVRVNDRNLNFLVKRQSEERPLRRDCRTSILRGKAKKDLFDVIASIVTRWGCYEMVAAPVADWPIQSKISGLFSRTHPRSVTPMQCEPWISKARVKELEPKAIELQALRAQIQRMHDLVGAPNCFLANTAFRKHDGTFKAVQDVEVGDALRLANGEVTHVTHATRLRPLVQDLVELVTNQASLRVSAKHRIVTTMGVRMARELTRNDTVMVGDRMRPLANARPFQEGVELFDVRFDPDAPIEAFVIPNYGIQVLGAAPPLMEVFRNIPAEELMRAMPAEYKD